MSYTGPRTRRTGCGKKANVRELLIALSAFWRVHRVLRRLNVRTTVVHRETLVLLACAGRAFSEVLLTLVELVLSPAIDTDILARADFFSRLITLLFGQILHQSLV